MDFFEDKVSNLKFGIVKLFFCVFDPIDEFLDGETGDFIDIEAIDLDR